jgi:hypothetical protein
MPTITPMFITKEQITREVRQFIREYPTMSILFWHREMNKISCLLKEDNSEWKNELKGFKKQVKDGRLKISLNNNRTKTFEGKTFYQMVMNIIDDDGEFVQCPSPLSMMAFGYRRWFDILFHK